jgi:hypothetical protein
MEAAKLIVQQAPEKGLLLLRQSRPKAQDYGVLKKSVMMFANPALAEHMLADCRWK